MTIIDRGGIEVVVGFVVVIVLVKTEVVVVIVSLTPMVVVVVILVDACGCGSCHRLRWWWNHIAGVVGVRVIVVVFIDVGGGGHGPMAVVNCSGGMAVVAVNELMSREASEAMCVMCVEWPAQRQRRMCQSSQNASQEIKEVKLT